MENNVENYDNIRYILLPPQFITKGFIGGEGAPSCNYEEYLVELLNESEYFMEITKGKPFILNKKQNHGECDAICDSLSLDFKLIGGESAIASHRHTSHSVTNLTNGGVGYGIPDGKRDKYEAVRIHLALKNYSYHELLQLREKYTKKDLIQYDVVEILKSLEVNKNLLLFLPYAIIVEEPCNTNSLELITNVLKDCFGSALEYREKAVSDKKTFFCCVNNQQMLFYNYSNKKLKLVDSVYTYSSKTFIEISRYVSFLDIKTIKEIIGEDHIWIG